MLSLGASATRQKKKKKKETEELTLGFSNPLYSIVSNDDSELVMSLSSTSHAFEDVFEVGD